MLTPDHAIAAFEHFTRLRVTVYDLERSLAAHLPPGRFTHFYGLCRKVKYSAQGDVCLRFALDELRSEIASFPEGRFHICHAGLIEWVVPVSEGKRLPYILFAGTRTAAPSLRGAHLASDANVHLSDWRDDPLWPPPVEDNEAEMILEALRQLGARLRLWRREHQRGVDAPRADTLQREHAIRNLIAQRCVGPLKLADVAKALHLSPSRAAHVIKEVCGVGFVELLTEYRLRLAAEYLRHTDEPVAQIGRLAGFGDESHFYRVFKSKLGMTPRQYRGQRETRD